MGLDSSRLTGPVPSGTTRRCPKCTSIVGAECATRQETDRSSERNFCPDHPGILCPNWFMNIRLNSQTSLTTIYRLCKIFRSSVKSTCLECCCGAGAQLRQVLNEVSPEYGGAPLHIAAKNARHCPCGNLIHEPR